MKKRGKREGYSVWNHLVYLLRGIWSSDRVLMVLMVLEALSIVITPYVAMYLPKIGVDLVAARADSGEAACILGGLTIVVMISQAVGNMASRGKSVRQNRLRSHYRTLLFCKTLDCDYEHVESAEWQHKYNEAKVMSVDWGSWSGTTLMTEGAVKVCGAVVSFVLYGRIIGTLSLWVLLMIIVLSMINFAMLRRAQKYEVERIGERSVLQTSRSYMRDCSCDVRLGKDIRLYEMGDWIRSRFAHYNEAHFRLRREVQRRYFGAAFVEAASMFARDGISYLYFFVAGGPGEHFHRGFYPCVQCDRIVFGVSDPDLGQCRADDAGGAAPGQDARLSGFGRRGSVPGRRGGISGAAWGG